jgi:tetratricopeptide (TPR) repeat protein
LIAIGSCRLLRDLTRFFARLLLSSCLLLSWAGLVVAQGTPEILVEAGARSVYEGEAFLYRITLNHIENPQAPMLLGFDDFTIQSVGEQSLDSHQLIIINGVRREEIRRGRQYDFRLTPKKSGLLTIPPPRAKVDGNELLGKELSIRVLPVVEQDRVLLQVTADRETVYPTQAFTVTLSILVRPLPQSVQDRDPLTVQSELPELAVPWFVEERIPDGLEPELGWREILEPLISRRGSGFQMNEIRNSSVFSMFERNAVGFHPTARRVNRKGLDGEEVNYWEYVFTRTFIPKTIGRYEFGPVSIKGTFATEFSKRKLAGEEVYAMTKGVSVNVVDVPLEGRPETFIGAIGKFSLSSELTPTKVRVGDPMTLTLSLSGQGSLEDARPPDLCRISGIDENFRTYEATTETKGRDKKRAARKFIYSLRPLRTETEQFPSIPLSYFDVEQGKYVTVASEPISLQVLPAEVLSDAQIVSAGAAPRESGLQVSTAGLFANDADLSRLHNESLAPKLWLAGWSGMFVAYVLGMFAVSRVRQWRSDPAAIRRRGAFGRFHESLAEANALRLANQARSATDQLGRAVVTLVADYLQLSAEGLTAGDISNGLLERGISEPLRHRVSKFLQRCDEARFGALSEDLMNLQLDAQGLGKELHQALQNRPTKRISTVGLLLVLFGLCLGCDRSPDLDTVRLFQEAERRFAQAQSAEDFQQIAGLYQQILDRGIFSGTVLYNQGNAWMSANKTGRAIAAYRQAERLRPRDPYLAANLSNAVKSVSGGSLPKARSWFDYPLFWRGSLSLREEFLAFTIGLSLVLMLAALSEWMTWLKTFAWSGALFLFPLGASLYLDWRDEFQRVHGVVVNGPVVAYKGNSTSFEPAFTQPLPIGTEFVAIEERAEWLRIVLTDLGEGWVPKTEVVTW